MPAPGPIPDPDASTAANPTATTPTQRHDGWTPARQQAFLTALADGHTVESACALVGLSPASAYALRRRPAGAAFALAWRAACLLARDALADVLIRRVIDGHTDTYTRANGETITRHRYDHRLAVAMLTRLDRLADAPAAPRASAAAGQGPCAPGPHASAPHAADAARLVAADWDRFVALLAHDDPTTAATAFVATASASAAPTAAAPASGSEVAADGAHDGMCEVPQLRPHSAPQNGHAAPAAAADPVVRDPRSDEWITWFPPPPGFGGRTHGDYGDADYHRTLSPAESAVHQRRRAAAVAALAARDGAARDTWFGFVPDPAPADPAPADPAPADPEAPDIAAAANAADTPDPADYALPLDHDWHHILRAAAVGWGKADRARPGSRTARHGAPAAFPDAPSPELLAWLNQPLPPRAAPGGPPGHAAGRDSGHDAQP